MSCLCDVLGATIQWNLPQQQPQQQPAVTSPAALAKKIPAAVSVILLSTFHDALVHICLVQHVSVIVWSRLP